MMETTASGDDALAEKYWRAVDLVAKVSDGQASRARGHGVVEDMKREDAVVGA